MTLGYFHNQCGLIITELENGEITPERAHERLLPLKNRAVADGLDVEGFNITLEALQKLQNDSNQYESSYEYSDSY